MNAPFTPIDLHQREDASEWAQEQFHEWIREGIRGLRECDNNPREDADYDEWLDLMSQPHIRDCERFRAARLVERGEG